MRITGGILKGRIINPPRSFKARPTTDMAKEGLFNILSNRYDFEGMSILDLFAGSGSISIEFASRGCTQVISVEKDYFHFQFIKKNIIDFGLPVSVLHDDVFRFLQKNSRQFDLIFADPPYTLPNLESLPDKILSGNNLKSDGLFVLEHPKACDFSKNIRFKELRRYGNVHFSFFR